MVAMETDSDCGPVMEQADILYQKMLGAKMLTNSEITNHLRTIMDYLLMWRRKKPKEPKSEQLQAST